LNLPEAYKKTVLPSGLRIVSESIPYVSSLSIGVWIDVGSRDESKEQNGISHFVEHAVFKGTARRKTHHIAQYLEAVGGFLNAFTTKDSTCYYARVLDRHLGRAMEILSDLILNPAFPEREIEKEKQVIFEEMKSAEDDPEDIINDYLDEIVFARHPLSQPVIGTARAVNSFTSECLRRFVQTMYTSGRIVIAASGAVNHDELVALAEAKFSALPQGRPAKRRKPGRHPVKELVLRKPSQQSHLLMGIPVGGVRDDGYYALSVLNTLLGDGMSSRLFQNVREKYGYAYNVYSALASFEDAGIFSVYAGAENGAIYKARDLIIKTLEEVRKQACSKREIQRAMEQVIGGIILGLESMDNRMHRIGRDELSLGREIPVAEMVQTISALTADDIFEAAQTVCDPSKFTSVLILPVDESPVRS